MNQVRLSGLEVSGGIRTKSGGLRINRSVSADLAVSVHLRDGGLGGFRGDGPADATTQSTERAARERTDNSRRRALG